MADMERMARMGLCAINTSPTVSAELRQRYNPNMIDPALSLWVRLRDPDDQTSLARAAQAVNMFDLAAETKDSHTRFIIPGDEEWPTQLADLAGKGAYDAPYGLWVRGPLSLSAVFERSVAIVGSRSATAYGEHVASELGYDIASRGYTVVSGGAYGIDASAHRGALAADQGRTIAVLAGGVVDPYPPGNHLLFDQIASTGALVSENPPSAALRRREFLRRNRLIPALTQATVVVEGASRSGTANIAEWATMLGRPIGAIPGPITSAMSAQPHRLIKEDAARIVISADDIIALAPPVQERQELSRDQSLCQQPISAVIDMKQIIAAAAQAADDPYGLARDEWEERYAPHVTRDVVLHAHALIGWEWDVATSGSILHAQQIRDDALRLIGEAHAVDENIIDDEESAINLMSPTPDHSQKVLNHG